MTWRKILCIYDESNRKKKHKTQPINVFSHYYGVEK